MNTEDLAARLVRRCEVGAMRHRKIDTSNTWLVL